MGLIGKLIGGIFSLIGGIFGGVGKLLGFGKKSDYFMEAASAAAESVGVKVEPAKEEKATPAKSNAAPVAATKTAAKTAEAPAQPAASPAPAKATKLKKSKQTESTPESAPAAPQHTVAKTQTDLTFAPNFLLSPGSTNGRRRPGPSMDYFRNMAKQVKS
jgi:hypothetical protein